MPRLGKDGKNDYGACRACIAKTGILPNVRFFEYFILFKEKYKCDERDNIMKKSNSYSTKIFANIFGIDGISDALLNNADGIGLFRSEFLYFENGGFPSENAQFSIYKKALSDMVGKPVIIRTFDLGQDKQITSFAPYDEQNPALGLRGIRLSLTTHTEIFKTQLRALYRASVYGNLGIIFPMITGVVELDAIKKILAEVKTDLKNHAIPYSDNIKIGIMLETPAAAILSDELSLSADFFSVGTNDLIQFTLACDRQNAELKPFIDKSKRALMRLIECATKNAHDAGIPIGICGELAADTAFTEAFIKMGIDYLSVSPQNIPFLRDFIRNLHSDNG